MEQTPETRVSALKPWDTPRIVDYGTVEAVTNGVVKDIGAFDGFGLAREPDGGGGGGDIS